MMDEAELTTFQVEVAHIFLRLNASEGYVVRRSSPTRWLAGQEKPAAVRCRRRRGHRVREKGQ